MTREPRSTIGHRGWMDLATEEYRRLGAVLAALTTPQWDAPTDCPGWSVRDIVAHLVGAAEATASVREQLRQQRLGRKHKGNGLQIDAVNDVQVRERAGLDPVELRRQLADAARRSLRARVRTPAAVRALRFPFPPPVGWASLGYLNDTVYTRDAWMHRVDICRATDTPVEFTAEHDALIVADAARAWQHVTGSAEPVPTGLTGVGEHSAGREPGHDAVEFARALSGRTHLPGIRPDVVLF